MYNEEVCKKCANEVGPNYFKKVAIKDFYVYEWLEYNRIFYVGKGKGRRALTCHDGDVQDIKKRTKEFYVRIVEHGMSESDAYFLEGKLIKLRRMEGYQLENISSQQCTRVVEPEELFFTF